jgi:hypothetical protein
MILLCNLVARGAREAKTYPHASSEVIVSAVERGESQLAAEIINSYCHIYPNIASIISVLRNQPLVIRGSVLDKMAPHSRKYWNTEYSPTEFKKLVTELGIIGRVREEYKPGNRYVKADFEYALEERLDISEQDVCVFHPMFFRRLDIKTDGKVVFPFPGSSDGDVSIE